MLCKRRNRRRLSAPAALVARAIPIPTAREVCGHGLLRVEHKKATSSATLFIPVPAAKSPADCLQPCNMTTSGSFFRDEAPGE
jgi:hypothetical protein